MSSTISISGCSGTRSQAQKDTFLSVYGCELATPDADRICCVCAPSTAMQDRGICIAPQPLSGGVRCGGGREYLMSFCSQHSTAMQDRGICIAPKTLIGRTEKMGVDVVAPGGGGGGGRG